MPNSFGQQSHCLGVRFEPTKLIHEFVQRSLPCVPKRWMTEIVGEANSLNQIGIDMKVLPEMLALFPKEGTDRSPNLRDLNRMCQSGSVEIVFPRPEDLGLGLQPPKGVAVNYAIPVHLKGSSVGVALPA